VQSAIPDHMNESDEDLALEGAGPRNAVLTQPPAPRTDPAVPYFESTVQALFDVWIDRLSGGPSAARSRPVLSAVRGSVRTIVSGRGTRRRAP
jgi:hypothetical protein